MKRMNEKFSDDLIAAAPKAGKTLLKGALIATPLVIASTVLAGPTAVIIGLMGAAEFVPSHRARPRPEIRVESCSVVCVRARAAQSPACSGLSCRCCCSTSAFWLWPISCCRECL